MTDKKNIEDITKKDVNDMSNFLMPYGKYKGMSLIDIINKKKSRGFEYLKWLIKKNEEEQKNIAIIKNFIFVVSNNFKSETISDYSFID